MHESALTAGLIRTVAEKARSLGADRVTEIRLLVGEMSGVEPLLIESAFGPLSTGTPAEGAALTVVSVALVARCGDCRREFRVEGFRFRCPDCGSGRTEVVSGEEIVIESFTIESPSLEPTGAT